MYYSLEYLVALCREQSPHLSDEEIFKKANELRLFFNRSDSSRRRSEIRRYKYYLAVGMDPDEYEGPGKPKK